MRALLSGIALSILGLLFCQPLAHAQLFGDRKKSQCASEIAQLSVAVAAFKNQFDVDHLPSRIKLSETGNYDPKVLLDQESMRYLKKCFPRSNLQKLDWNGNGMIDAPDKGGDVILEGDQCLVFFLGGINGKGFGDEPANPTAESKRRIGPFFDFPSNRLQARGNAAGKAGYKSFVDGYGSNVYAYFSSYSGDDYNHFESSDCAALDVWPYASATKPDLKFMNSKSFQILCAGKNGKFGKGTIVPDGKPWTPLTAAQVYPPESDGADDLSNFHETYLGK